jgi:hypothetical protein
MLSSLGVRKCESWWLLEVMYAAVLVYGVLAPASTAYGECLGVRYVSSTLVLLALQHIQCVVSLTAPHKRKVCAL